MEHPKTPRTDALFGIFLQDIREIRQKHPRTFRKRYCNFDYSVGDKDRFNLVIKPDILPKGVKKEILRAFDIRLNQFTELK